MAKSSPTKTPRRSARLAAAKSSTHATLTTSASEDQTNGAGTSSTHRAMTSTNKPAVTKSIAPKRPIPRKYTYSSYFASSRARGQSSANLALAATSNATNRFLTLPGELRNKIYAMAIEDDLANAEDDKARIQLLLTTPRFVNSCSQIRSEGITLFRPSRIYIYDRAHKLFFNTPDSPNVNPRLHYRLKGKLRTHRRYFAAQHKSVKKACTKWFPLLEWNPDFTFAGAVEWDTQLGVKPMSFLAEGPGMPL